MKTSLISFCEIAEQVAATTKRLEKASLLAGYLQPLSDTDLALASRYFAGQVFSLRDGRVANIGGSAIMKALAAITQKSPDELQKVLVQHGDFGNAACQVLSQRTPQLALEDLADFFVHLAATSGANLKLELLVDFLTRADALEAKYILKFLSGELRIGLQEGAVEDALARMTGAAVGEVQRANMMLGDLGETAVRARAGELSAVRMKLFHPIKFMLASPAADLAEVARQMPDEFVVEDKFDGIRAQAHIALVEDEKVGADQTRHGEVLEGVRVAIFSRTLGEITQSFPDLLQPLSQLVSAEIPALLLDGEIVPISPDAKEERVLPFQVLQQRLGRKKLIEDFQYRNPVAFVAYDLMFEGSDILLEEPFHNRRERLGRFQPDAQKRFRVVQWRSFNSVTPLDDEFDAARARGNEGLMVKDPASTYKPGRRGKEWLKIKRALATLDVVVTAVETGNGRRSKVLSDYTFAVRAGEDDPALLSIGKAYSGLTDKEIAEMSEWFRAHTLQEFGNGKVRLVEPQIVIEVAFDNVQVSKRHKSGYALRFPRIVRLRPDKPAGEIDTLETVRKLAQ